MTEENTWIIRWTGYVKNSYLYGSEIHFEADGSVSFENGLIPPGTAIHTWYSETNYQTDRIEPELPLIDGERSYRITSEMESDVPEGLLLEILFFDKNGKNAGHRILRGSVLTVRPPISTYSYEIRLISGGAHRFTFHRFLMEELPEEEDRASLSGKGTD